jgi:hypothetical protein
MNPRRFDRRPLTAGPPPGTLPRHRPRWLRALICLFWWLCEPMCCHSCRHEFHGRCQIDPRYCVGSERCPSWTARGASAPITPQAYSDDEKPWPFWGWREKCGADLHRAMYRLVLWTLAHPDRTADAAAAVEDVRTKLEAGL